MKYTSTLLAVQDIECSKSFYQQVLGLSIVSDFGSNVVLTGGIALQTLRSWAGFLRKEEKDILFANHAGELYFEEDDIEAFMAHLQDKDIQYVHPLIEHRWGQRVVRFYDPDRHIIEVGENMVIVVRRFLQSGLSAEETAVRMDVPVEYVRSCMECK